jgi:hypothetical protein
MPNNTDVRVYIDHTSKSRIDDMEWIFNTDEPFNQILPMPDDILRDNLTYEQRKESNGRNWYDWSVENWGTKWDAYNVRVQRLSDTSLYVMMETAWSPPIPIFKKLVELGFEVSAYYLDEGHMYIGQFECGEDFCFEVNRQTPYNLIDEFNIEFDEELEE